MIFLFGGKPSVFDRIKSMMYSNVTLTCDINRLTGKGGTK